MNLKNLLWNRRRGAAVTAWAVAGLVVVSSPALAVGPDLPLRFDADPIGKDVAILPLIVDAKQVSDVRIERQIFRNGELLDRSQLKVELAPSVAYGRADGEILEARLPLLIDGMQKLEPGPYAQKIVVEGRWTNVAESRPIHIERWSYFLVDEKGVRLLDLEEYSALADRSETALDAHGRRIQVNVGIDRKEDVPLSETKASSAVPLGRLGGLVEEQPTNGKSPYQKRAPDRSEADED